MRNRAKCKLCNSIIESFHEFDRITCQCDEISITGGQVRYECSSKNWNNFVRIADDDSEINVTVQDQPKPEIMEIAKDKDYYLSLVSEMIAAIDHLPEQAKYSACTQMDYQSLLYLIKGFISLS